MLLVVLIFVAVSMGLVAGAQVFAGLWGKDAARLRKRLADEFAPKEAAAAASPLFKNLDQLSLDREASNGAWQGDPLPSAAGPGASSFPTPFEMPMPRLPVPVSTGRSRRLSQRIQKWLDQARVPLPPRIWAAFAVVLGALGGGLGYLLGGPWLAGASLLLGLAAPWLFIHAACRRQRDKLLRQLPNAFDLMARVLRAGQSVGQALQAVAEAFDNPIKDEFAQCQKHQSLGLRPEVTYQEMAERCGILELGIFVMAMVIQRQTGGNLSEVLERLAQLVRARLKLRQQVRTLTAEGRLQGWTLLLLPFLTFAAMFAINRTYAESLLEHPGLLAATFISMTAGMFWIRRIVRIDL
jgi:tight adherence protein B